MRTTDKSKDIIDFEKNANKLKSHVDKEEQQKLHFHFDRNGNVKANSLYNIELILENDPELQGMFKFNEFTNEIDVVKSSKKMLIKPGQLKDTYIDEIASYIERNKDDYHNVLFDNKHIRSALNVVAARHQYNPVTDYFNDAVKHYDGESHIENFFTKWLGVEPTPVTMLIAKIWFVGGVAKAYDPTCKFDFVLDLVGGQGAGKTTILQKLAPCGYYTDQFSTFDNKDDFAVMRRNLIVNDDEMTATNNSSFEILKKFVTLQVFEYRKPYGHQSERFPKGFIMARTTNNLYYLKDKTGERRFLPLLVDKNKQQFNPVTELTSEDVRQVWGETVQMYQNDDYSFDLTAEQQAMLDDHRKNFMYTDTLEDSIADALDNDWKNVDFLSSETIGLKVVPGVDLAKNRKLSNQIANIMVNRFGWRKGRKRINGKNNRGYVKK